jgi:hypothetical protein
MQEKSASLQAADASRKMHAVRTDTSWATGLLESVRCIDLFLELL